MNNYQIDRLIDILEDAVSALRFHFFPVAPNNDALEIVELTEHIDDLEDDIEMLENDLADANQTIDDQEAELEAIRG
jgi:peptidoglycan hydrolase CwlO-like protein